MSHIAKRGFDLAVTGLLLVALSPLLALIALLIKLTSRGPVLYVRERVGKDGALFPSYKFRTMVVDAERRGLGIEVARTDVLGDVAVVVNDGVPAVAE